MEAAVYAPDFVGWYLARGVLDELDPGMRRFGVGRGARGVYHVTALVALQHGRLMRHAGQKLCASNSLTLRENVRWDQGAPTCSRCLRIIERMNMRQLQRVLR